jgi:hypothetical protein
LRNKLFILVLALQTAWVLGMVFQQERLLRGGAVVLLETQPVDPRDLLRGDFVRLNYVISDIPQKFFPAPWTPPRRSGAIIYVALAPDITNQFWEISRASTDHFVPASNEVLLQGNSEGTWNKGSSSLRVRYGIEKYYVAEGTGNPSGKLTAQVAIDSAGRATLKEVFVDGKPYTQAVQMAP